MNRTYILSSGEWQSWYLTVVKKVRATMRVVEELSQLRDSCDDPEEAEDLKVAWNHAFDLMCLYIDELRSLDAKP